MKDDRVINTRATEIDVLNTTVAVLPVNDQDYISLTDMLKAKNGDFFISDWLRNRNTVEFLGIWETVHNPDFNYGGFAAIKTQVGLNSYKLSVKEWVANTTGKGNVRDYANGAQLICLANMESLNAVFIRDGLSQCKRLERLNQIAISQMSLLVDEKIIKSWNGINKS